jgi:PEP-CTERM/exosortase A-associated glycosyltransferase
MPSTPQIPSEPVTAVSESSPDEKERCRVLHVLDHSMPLLSGYSVRSHSLITAQRHIGLFPEVVTGPLHNVEDVGASDTFIDEIRYDRTGLAPGLEKRFIEGRVPVLREMSVVRLLRRRILQILDRQPFDVIHAHSPALCGLAASQAARARNLPFVYEIRAFWEDAAVDQDKTKVWSPRYQVSRQLEGYVARRADAVVGIAKHILQDMQERGIDGDKLFHVPNGVNAGRFGALPRDTQLAAQLGLNEKPVLGFIGSLYRYEGIAWMLRAAANLIREGVSFQILVVGQGEELKDVQAAIQELGMQDRFKAVGQVPHDQVQRYYSLMDVMVYPRRSIRLTELTTPLKPLEAMAQGKAVLASDVGGIRELVEPQIPCFLFKADDAEDFCAKAKELISDSHLRRELGEKGRQMVLQEKDWNILAQRYKQVYSSARKRLRLK